MEPTTSRVRVATTFVVTLLVVLGEFLLLMSVYHLDDDSEREQYAHARFAGQLDAWRPGDPGRPLVRSADALAATGATGADRLQRLTRGWAATGDATGLERLRQADVRVGEAIGQDQHSADLRAALIFATLLVLVSIGWFAWFRKLVRRHRALQRGVTEQQVLDAGERRLLALVQNSVDLVAVLEPDSTASFVSPSARSVLGLSPEELIGRRFVDLLVPGDVPAVHPDARRPGRGRAGR